MKFKWIVQFSNLEKLEQVLKTVFGKFWHALEKKERKKEKKKKREKDRFKI